MNDQILKPTGEDPKRARMQHREDSVGVILPCTVGQFGEFITSLLGKSQVIEGGEYGSFDIENIDIVNAIQLISQRVTAQNEASVVSFEISVIYSNGNKVTHDTLEAFNNYYPVEPCHPIEVTVSIVYLILFKGRQIPEKQRIEITFVAEDHHWGKRIRRFRGEGVIEYRVEYTERTWGSDISTIMRNHAKSLMSHQNKFFTWMTQNFDECSMAVFVTSFVAVVGGWSWQTSRRADQLTALGTFIPYLSWSIFTFSVLAGLLIVLHTIFQYNMYFRKPSSIVLVERDRKFRKDEKTKFTRRVLLAISGWFLSVVASLVASIVYTRF